MEGASNAPPSATVRTAATISAGGMSLSTKPLAPARSALYTYSSGSNVVRITTRTSQSASSMIRDVASRPSISGMRMSMRITSGR